MTYGIVGTDIGTNIDLYTLIFNYLLVNNQADTYDPLRYYCTLLLLYISKTIMKYYYVSFLWTHSIKISPRYYFHWNYFITSTFKILIILPREALFCVQKNHSIEQNRSHPTGRAAVYKCKITVNSGHILHWIFISSVYIHLDFFFIIWNKCTVGSNEKKIFLIPSIHNNIINILHIYLHK